MKSVTLGLVGTGAREPSTLLAARGNVLAEDALRELKDLGAGGASPDQRPRHRAVPALPIPTRAPSSSS